MATINASTKFAVKKKAPVVPSSKSAAPKSTTSKTATSKSTAATSKSRGATAPPLKPAVLKSAAAIQDFIAKDDKIDIIQEWLRTCLGDQSQHKLSAPHHASTNRDREAAAADIAIGIAELNNGTKLLKEAGVFDTLQHTLFPEGIQVFMTERYNYSSSGMSTTGNDNNNNEDQISVIGLKPSTSALSLASLENMSINANSTVASDSKRGKTTPANARHGAWLLLRALCEKVGRSVAPYICGAYLAAALDECGSSHGDVRQAALDASKAILNIISPWAFFSVAAPLMRQVLLTSNEWRVKSATLECIEQCATIFPKQVHLHIPELIPLLTPQVWDTKPQVSKAARSALLAVCQCNPNADIKPAIPAIVQAIGKPATTNSAVSELMGTTFVVPVDASTLAMLCPVLARALKEKLAIHKRAACLVISNMSKLVETPQAVAPFGSLLVPELQKVSHNVQFEEIRDEALKALANLTKALGDAYVLDDTATAATMESEIEAMADETKAEQDRIKAEREAELARQAEIKAQEEAEKKRFREAMDAQRELARIEAEEAERARQEELLKRETARLSTKGSTGKCQGCGLKKCKKTCMFYTEQQ